MALEEYKKKRNFAKSPEPEGTIRSKAAAAPLFFCVQKHLASHLHYDFRLEHEGVLLSWAVPKGPSLDPTVKRLAMHVEDHPIEYGDFEGVIPEGYGAGIVMLWDQGTWEPQVSDVGAALRKGDLKFRLDGVKLKGSWALVRTRSAGERSWLLLKHRDEWAGAVDIAEFAPLSVKSGGDLADILAEENPSVWQSNRPARGGDTGAMFARIIERALEIRGGTKGGTKNTKGTTSGLTKDTRETTGGSTKDTKGRTGSRTKGGTKNTKGTTGGLTKDTKGTTASPTKDTAARTGSPTKHTKEGTTSTKRETGRPTKATRGMAGSPTKNTKGRKGQTSRSDPAREGSAGRAQKAPRSTGNRGAARPR